MYKKEYSSDTRVGKSGWKERGEGGVVTDADADAGRDSCVVLVVGQIDEESMI